MVLGVDELLQQGDALVTQPHGLCLDGYCVHKERGLHEIDLHAGNDNVSILPIHVAPFTRLK